MGTLITVPKTRPKTSFCRVLQGIYHGAMPWAVDWRLPSRLVSHRGGLNLYLISFEYLDFSENTRIPLKLLLYWNKWWWTHGHNRTLFSDKATYLNILLSAKGSSRPSAEDAFDSFAHFTRQQVNLQKEAGGSAGEGTKPIKPWDHRLSYYIYIYIYI